MGQYTHLSTLPGLNNAGSMRLGRLVAAKIKTPSRPSTPSNCVSNWLTTLSVTPVLSWPLRGARASNSSKNKIQGLAVWALKWIGDDNMTCMYLTVSRGSRLQHSHNPVIVSIGKKGAAKQWEYHSVTSVVPDLIPGWGRSDLSLLVCSLPWFESFIQSLWFSFLTKHELVS